MGTEMTHPQDECSRTQDPGIHGSWVWSPDNRDTSDPLDLGYASIQGSGPWMVLLLLLWTLWGPGEQETITSNTHVAQGLQPWDIRCMQVAHILYTGCVHDGSSIGSTGSVDTQIPRSMGSG